MLKKPLLAAIAAAGSTAFVANYRLTDAVPYQPIADSVTGSRLLVERDSVHNVEQTGPMAPIIASFPDNYPAVNEGDGLMSQVRTVNLLNNALLLPDTILPFNWTAPGLSGTQTGIASTLNPNAAAWRMAGTNAAPYLQASNTFVMSNAGDKLYLSVFIEAVDGAQIAAQDLLNSVAIGGTIAKNYPVCSANPSGGPFGLVGTGRLLLEITSQTAAISVTFRFGPGATSGNVTADYTMVAPQLQTNYFSNFVESIPNAQGLRETDIPSICTVAEKGAAYDTGAGSIAGTLINRVSNFTDATFTNGIRVQGEEVSFAFNAGAQQGKYGPEFSGGAPDMVGAHFIGSNGAVCQVTGDDTLGTLVTDMIYIPAGETAASAAVAFEFPNTFAIDFIPSAYFSDRTNFAADLIQVENLRNAAGDSLANIPAAELWPEFNFELAAEFTPTNPGDNTNAMRVMEWALDGTNRVLFIRRADQVRLISGGLDVAGTTDIILNTIMEVNRRYRMVWTFTANNNRLQLFRDGQLLQQGSDVSFGQQISGSLPLYLQLSKSPYAVAETVVSDQTTHSVTMRKVAPT